ncbi:OLC1v1016785C1 [Oldenlandia corymbosa var. corymbosa]|nr:OLC1v1016785C1 [Oldenlandia corymbosa var. corymbosa]
MKVASTLPPNINRGPDTCCWPASDSGQFNTSSAYQLVEGDSIANCEPLWRAIWTWSGSERVKTCLWLAAKGKLMTNMERHRRHIGSSPLCLRCAWEPESITHVFWDCPNLRQIWDHLLIDNLNRDFYEENFWEWAPKNLMEKNRGNKEEGEGTGGGCQICGLIRGKQWSEKTRTYQMDPPPPGWLKLNTDGSYNTISQEARAGGLIRNEEGGWVKGFTMNVGTTTVTGAELWGVWQGLILAWEIGARKIIVEVDSSTAIRLGSNQSNETGVHDRLIKGIWELMDRDWSALWPVFSPFLEGTKEREFRTVMIWCSGGGNEKSSSPGCWFGGSLKQPPVAGAAVIFSTLFLKMTIFKIEFFCFFIQRYKWGGIKRPFEAAVISLRVNDDGIRRKMEENEVNRDGGCPPWTTETNPPRSWDIYGNMDAQISPPVTFFNGLNLPDQSHHPPYIPPFQVVGLAPATVEEQVGGPELQWNYGFEPRRKRPKEQDFLDNNPNNNNSQISSVDFLQARSVSTGLGLSLDNTNNNINSSSNKAWLASSGDSAFLGIVGDEIDREFQRQDAEIDSYIKIQGDRLRQALMDKVQTNQLQTISYVEEKVLQTLREKEAEMEDINKKNMELELQMEQLAVEANAWQQRAQYNENMVKTLTLNIQQVFAQSRDSKEGCGDSEVDDTASCCNGQALDFHLLRKDGNDMKELMTCK